MQLKIGDQVVHPAFGIGRIAALEEKSFTKHATHHYFQVVRDRQSMWIRTESQDTNLRLVTAKSGLDHYRDLLKSTPVPLNANLPQRQADLIGRLTQGSFQGVCEVMRDLTAWGSHELLDRTDKRTLEKTRESLTQEWAASAEVSTAEAGREIDALMRVKD